MWLFLSWLLLLLVRLVLLVLSSAPSRHSVVVAHRLERASQVAAVEKAVAVDVQGVECVLPRPRARSQHTRAQWGGGTATSRANGGLPVERVAVVGAVAGSALTVAVIVSSVVNSVGVAIMAAVDTVGIVRAAPQLAATVTRSTIAIVAVVHNC
jgi:hypothetical protein